MLTYTLRAKKFFANQSLCEKRKTKTLEKIEAKKASDRPKKIVKSKTLKKKLKKTPSRAKNCLSVNQLVQERFINILTQRTNDMKTNIQKKIETKTFKVKILTEVDVNKIVNGSKE